MVFVRSRSSKVVYTVLIRLVAALQLAGETGLRSIFRLKVQQIRSGIITGELLLGLALHTNIKLTELMQMVPRQKTFRSGTMARI